MLFADARNRARGRRAKKLFYNYFRLIPLSQSPPARSGLAPTGGLATVFFCGGGRWTNGPDRTPGADRRRKDCHYLVVSDATRRRLQRAVDAPAVVAEGRFRADRRPPTRCAVTAARGSFARDPSNE